MRRKYTSHRAQAPAAARASPLPVIGAALPRGRRAEPRVVLDQAHAAPVVGACDFCALSHRTRQRAPADRELNHLKGRMGKGGGSAPAIITDRRLMY
jgi:hypothetical protein